MKKKPAKKKQPYWKILWKDGTSSLWPQTMWTWEDLRNMQKISQVESVEVDPHEAEPA